MARPGGTEGTGKTMNKDIVSALQEERTFPPGAQFAAQARIKPRDLEAMRQHASRGQYWRHV